MSNYLANDIEQQQIQDAHKIEQYAPILYDNYSRRRSRSHRQSSNRPPEIWYKIAENLVNLKAEPEAFLNAAWSEAQEHHSAKKGESGMIPWPNWLASPEWITAAWNRWGLVENGNVATLDIAVHDEWRMLIKITVDLLMKKCGTFDCGNAQVLEMMKDDFSYIPELVRCYYSDNNPEIIKNYGRQARIYLNSKPGLEEILFKEGYILPHV